jgi:NAD(P)H dehydrogenase (quinone)
VQVLVVHAHPGAKSFSHAIRDTAVGALERAGHAVTLLDLYAEGFEPRLSLAEWKIYETEKPILDPMVQRHVDALKRSDAIVFIYPTWWWGMPAMLKGWLERIMVKGVSFTLDPKTNKVVPGLSHVHRVVGISTYGSSRLSMLFFNDGGRRLVLRCVRILCPLTKARSTWLALYGLDRSSENTRKEFLLRIEKSLSAL